MTTIANLVGSERVLGQLVRRNLPTSNELVNSGLTVRNEDVDRVAAGGPRKGDLAMIAPLDSTKYNISTDVRAQQGEIQSLAASRYDVVRHDLNGAWGYTDLTTMVTKYPGQRAIEMGLIDYWNGLIKMFGMAAINGAIGSEDELTVGDGTGEFSFASVVDAAATAGVYADLYDTIIVNPIKYALIRKDQEGFKAPSETQGSVAVWNGIKVIQSSAVASTGTILARQGSLAMSFVSPFGLTETEIARDANGGNGGGAEVLHDRKSFVVHPQGFNYTGPVGVSHTAFGNSANWELAIDDLEQIGFRKLNTL